MDAIHRAETKRRRLAGATAKMVVGILILAAVAFVVVVAVLPAPANKMAPKVIPPVNVSVTRVETIPALMDTFRLPGTVEPKRVVRVAAEVDGRIERILGEEGRPIQAGQRLVLLNTELLQAEHDRTKATMEYDARESKRAAELASRGAATANEVDQARTAAAGSQAAHEAAKARLARAAIYAPVGGVLNHLPVEEGEYVTPGTCVAEIVEVDTVLVVVHVPEKDIQYLKAGQKEEVRIDSLGGRMVTGTITYISQVADPAARTTRAELTVDNAGRLLHSGQIVTVQLAKQELHDVILVPLSAAIPLEVGYTMYVVEDGKARPRHVRLGLFRGQDVRVLSGLAAGELLIVRGQHFVGPGQPVQIVPDGGGPSAGADDRAPRPPASAPATRARDTEARP